MQFYTGGNLYRILVVDTKITLYGNNRHKFYLVQEYSISQAHNMNMFRMMMEIKFM